MLNCIENPNPHLKADLKKGVLTLIIHRAEAKNAFDIDLYTNLQHAFEEAEHCNAVRILILRGIDTDFSAGNDLSSFLNLPELPTLGQAGSAPPFMLLKSVAKFSKPCIAAVRGACIGIANTLLLHFDLVYADQTAIFQMPFVRLGLSLEGAASLLLVKNASYHAAADLIFSGSKYNASQALSAGVINCIVDNAYMYAHEQAEYLASQPSASLKAVKALMKHNLDQILKCIDDEAEIVMQRARSPELFEAVSALMQKRKPDFSQFH